MHADISLHGILSSAGQAMESPLAGRASSVTLLAACVVSSVGTLLWAEYVGCIVSGHGSVQFCQGCTFR